MSFGIKRSRSVGVTRNSLGLLGRANPGSLFEKEWDELVIRFDEERQSYRVRTASQAAEKDDDGRTAKLRSENVI